MKTREFASGVAVWLCICGSLAVPSMAQTSVSWTGAVNGNWSDSTKWTPSMVPNNGVPPVSSDTFAVSIAALGPLYTVNLDVPVTVDSLTLSAAAATFTQQAALALSNGGNIKVNAGTYRLVNSTITGATISVAPAASFHFLAGTLIDSTLAGNATIDTGLVLKGTSALSNSILHVGSGVHLELNNYPDTSTLAGSGQVIFDGPQNGYINSPSSIDIAPGITISTGGGGAVIESMGIAASVTNRGVIQAKTSGQSITFEPNYSASVYNQGTFSASNGATLIVNRLTGDAGTLALAGSSVLDLRGNFSVGQSLTLSSGNYLKLSGNFSIDKPLTANAGSKIELGGTWTNTAAVNIQSATVYLDGPYTHTAAAPFTVSSSSVILAGSFPTASVRPFFVNHNTVTLGSSSSIKNTGDTLALDATTGTIQMNDAGIFGGSVTAAGGAKLIANSGFNYMWGVDLNSNVQIVSGATFSFGDNTLNPGASVNHAAISGSGATVSFTGQWHNLGTVNLSGGTLEFAGPALDMGNITVANTAVNLKSSISSQQLNSIAGTMSQIVISDQGRLDLGGSSFGPSSATGPIYFNGGTIQNGTLNAPGANKVLTSGGGAYGTLDHVTLATDLTIVPNYKLSVLNGLTLSGNRITIDNNLTQYYQRSGLFMNYGTQSVAGTGEVVFDGPGSAGVFEAYASTLTIAPGITVRTGNGSGYIGGDMSGVGSGAIINQGTIRADGAGRKIEFTGFNTFSNPGRLEAKNGGTLLFTGVNTYFPNWTNDGTIHLENAGNVTITGTSFTNGPTGRIEGNGVLNVTGTTFVNDGYIAPGLSPGLLSITGNLKETSNAVLLIQIAGTALSQYDRLTVSGTTTFAGTLDIELLNGFVPSPEDQFQILTAGSVSGGFGQIVTHGGDFNVTMDNGRLILTGFAVPEPSSLAAIGIGAACMIRRWRRTEDAD